MGATWLLPNGVEPDTSPALHDRFEQVVRWEAKSSFAKLPTKSTVICTRLPRPFCVASAPHFFCSKTRLAGCSEKRALASLSLLGPSKADIPPAARRTSRTLCRRVC